MFSFGAHLFGSCDCGVVVPSSDNCGVTCFDDCTSCCPSDSCLADCCSCYNSNRNCLWVSGEYLLWGFSKPNAPPLVTSGTGGVGTNGSAGYSSEGGSGTGPALGQAGTHVLYGGDTFNTDAHSGARLTFGFWCPKHDDWGMEFSGMYLAANTTSFSAGPSSTAILGRPFLDVTPGSFITATGQSPFQSTELVNFPGLVNGSVRVDYTSQLWGADANVLYKLCCKPNFRLNFLMGYRYLALDENITINENLSGPFLVTDRFATHNSFNGGQIGFDGEYRFCKCWFIGGTVKLAVGDMTQSANIAGSQQLFANTGVFANSTNVGKLLTAMPSPSCPKGRIKLGVDITDRLPFLRRLQHPVHEQRRPSRRRHRPDHQHQLPGIRGAARRRAASGLRLPQLFLPGPGHDRGLRISLLITVVSCQWPVASRRAEHREVPDGAHHPASRGARAPRYSLATGYCSLATAQRKDPACPVSSLSVPGFPAWPSPIVCRHERRKRRSLSWNRPSTRGVPWGPASATASSSKPDPPAFSTPRPRPWTCAANWALKIVSSRPTNRPARIAFSSSMADCGRCLIASRVFSGPICSAGAANSAF